MDLHAALIADIAERIDGWLVENGAEAGAQLAPPTRGDADLALACHRYARVFRKAPQMIAEDVVAVVADHPLVAEASATAGFLNLSFDWQAVARKTLAWAASDDGALARSNGLSGQKFVVEFSSPNTNKPQHLGHCRNNILGATVSALLKAAGADVHRVNLVNDRGIHICKSMVAYKRFGEGVTPEQAGKKGDHLVGDFYVRFDQAFNAEYAAAGTDKSKDEWFNSDSALGGEARQMLLDWEAGDEGVRALWGRMNGWCEAGFAATYARMGVEFDQIYHESETYLLGKDLVEGGLSDGVFHRAENGAAVFDLEKIGLEGEKAVLRADGTSVYTTQDLGTAVKRHEEHAFDQMIYVVGNEQDHHFRVLFGILTELRPALKDRLHHLSYGMVELPEGKMKSREGTVVDADDLMDELRDAAAEQVREKWPDLGADEVLRRAEAIGLSGLKFFLLKFAPATTFTFDPKQSIQPNGETGPYCQYAYARGGRILKNLGEVDLPAPDYSILVRDEPRAVLTAMLRLPGEFAAAAAGLKPSLATKATFELAKAFATFYNHDDYRVLKASPAVQAALVELIRGARRMLGAALGLLGIEALEEM